VTTAMIEAVILDFDGLILDTETPFRRSWEEIYAEHGLTVPPAVWAELIGSSVDPAEAYDLLERHLGRAIDRGAIRERRMARELEFLKDEAVMPGVRELIEDATARGIRLAIASSSEREWVVGHLEAIGLSESFEAIACAEDVATTKPAPDLYEVVLASLGSRTPRTASPPPRRRTSSASPFRTASRGISRFRRPIWSLRRSLAARSPRSFRPRRRIIGRSAGRDGRGRVSNSIDG
jgi:HAD superfamily hydrolase (TIGR01509 family)